MNCFSDLTQSGIWYQFYSTLINNSAPGTPKVSRGCFETLEEAAQIYLINQAVNTALEYSGSETVTNFIVNNALSVGGAATLNGTITAPNATSTLGNQIANVGTLDTRYLGPVIREQTNQNLTVDTLGGWVQMAYFNHQSRRTSGSFKCSIFSVTTNTTASFEFAIPFDPYTSNANSVSNLPTCVVARNPSFVITTARMRMGPDLGSGLRHTYLDFKFNPATAGFADTRIYSQGSVLTHDLNPAYMSIDLTPVVNPNTTGGIILPEFLPCQGCVRKSTTGDFNLGVNEGLQVINDVDNTLKIYAEGAWRTITTW